MTRHLLLGVMVFIAMRMQEQKANVQTNRIVIVNAFDVRSLTVRKNKKELFRELTDSLQVYLTNHLKAQGADVSILPGFTNLPADSSIRNLMLAQQATYSVVIDSLEVYFREGQEKHKEEYGFESKVETSYDLCSRIKYSFYINGTLAKDTSLVDCAFFTTRSQEDRAITIKFGPDIVGKKKHTYGAVEKNAGLYVRTVLPMLKNKISE